MKKQLKQLEEFHKAFDPSWADAPQQIDEKTRDLRIALMQEELEELVEAMKEEPIEEIAKELADLLYVVYGTIGPYGLADKMEEIFDEVHRSNMNKFRKDGTTKRREDGKLLKEGSKYIKPDIKSILEK